MSWYSNNTTARKMSQAVSVHNARHVDSKAIKLQNKH